MFEDDISINNGVAKFSSFEIMDLGLQPFIWCFGKKFPLFVLRLYVLDLLYNQQKQMDVCISNSYFIYFLLQGGISKNKGATIFLSFEYLRIKA